MNYLNTREIQAELLKIMLAFDEMAATHNIRYSLDGGTLLGAVRHKGFIPWDDDIDVIVPRPDFERLVSHPEWAGTELRMEIPTSNEFPLPFIKLVNPSWRAQEGIFDGRYKEYLWVDIFPADPMPETSSERRNLMQSQRKAALRATRSYVNIDKSTTDSVKKLFKRILFPLHRIVFPARKQYSLLAEHAKQLSYGSTEEVGNVVWGPYSPDKPGFPIDDFDNLIELEFEGHKFKACPHWDHYLTGLYGNYMQLPPVDQRITHGMKVWQSCKTENTEKSQCSQ